VKRRTTFLATLVFLLAPLPLALGQDLQSPQKGPALPGEILGPQLIAWSQLQRPQPIPQPMPSPAPMAQPQQSPQSDHTNPPTRTEGPTAQSFTGTVLKEGNRYVLKGAGNNIYELDDQERAKQYEGKQVKVAGTLDAKGNSVHVTSIELMS
jgi:hypothetical protein